MVIEEEVTSTCAPAMREQQGRGWAGSRPRTRRGSLMHNAFLNDADGPSWKLLAEIDVIRWSQAVQQL